MSSDARRSIVIVGGVAGGASAATRARRLNEHARIILLERDSSVSTATCGLPYYVGEEITDRAKLTAVTPQLLARRFNVDVRTGHEALSIDRRRRLLHVKERRTGRVYEEQYDRLILSPGAAPIEPPLEGVHADNVFTLRALEDADAIKAWVSNTLGQATAQPRAVIVGGGYIGLEMAEQLHRLGYRLTVLNHSPQLLPPFDPEMAAFVAEELARQNVTLRLGDKVKQFRVAQHGNSARVTHVETEGGELLDADLVLMAIGVQPRSKLASDAGLAVGDSGGIHTNKYQQTSDPLIYAVGDAVEYTHAAADQAMRVALAGPASRSGRVAGEHAATDHCAEPMCSVLGTSIVRVFGVTAGITGLSCKAAEKLGRQSVAAVYNEARSHAGYYPGADSMVLKLTFDRNDGKLLGLQVVGGSGVDKRVDVVATAIHHGGTVRSLACVDLAYAPQFGAAKDPIHLLAFTACNQLDGVVTFVQPGEDLSRYQVVDVRTEKERAEQAIPGSLHIPLDDIRSRLGELDPSRPTVTVCGTGLRSYVAARILVQRGFRDVADLTGGMLMWSREQGKRKG